MPYSQGFRYKKKLNCVFHQSFCRTIKTDKRHKKGTNQNVIVSTFQPVPFLYYLQAFCKHKSRKALIYKALRLFHVTPTRLSMVVLMLCRKQYGLRLLLRLQYDVIHGLILRKEFEPSRKSFRQSL